MTARKITPAGFPREKWLTEFDFAAKVETGTVFYCLAHAGV